MAVAFCGISHIKKVPHLYVFLVSLEIIIRELVKQGSEALGSVGSRIGFVQVRMGLQFVALYTAIGLVPR